MTTTSEFVSKEPVESILEGHRCGDCGRFFQGGGSDRIARYCCATDRKCDDCGNAVGSKSWTVCRGCRDLRAIAKWEKFEIVEWDGETPLYDWIHDEYFFDEDYLRDYKEDHPHWVPRLVVCEPQHGRMFELDEWCCDELCEDAETEPTKEVSAAISTLNAWLKSEILSWRPGDQRVVVKLLS